MAPRPALRALRDATLVLAIAAIAGCGSSGSSTDASPQPTDASLADRAAQQRSCIGALHDHLAALDVKRIDSFFAQTLNGLIVCDATYGLSHIPTHEISAWLAGADGKQHRNVIVPDQPAEIAKLPGDPPARFHYQQRCILWMRRYLPASIAHDGDDADTAAADVFNGIEECDAVAGFATISREDLAQIIKSKDLE
jgi:hypothetical protein